MKWVTRSHVHVDRVACPWLIKRFIDSTAEFVFVPRSVVRITAEHEKGLVLHGSGEENGLIDVASYKLQLAG